jgi:hypothetical protein
MMNKDFSSVYFAVDQDEKFERMSENVLRRYDDNNLVFLSSLDQYDFDDRVNILLTEVIEHNTIDDAESLIKKALSYNFNKLIITTPNVEFNQFYTMEENMRHDDHHFELTRQEFIEIIEKCTDGKDVNVEFFQLGDSLNGIQPTQGCVIMR